MQANPLSLLTTTTNPGKPGTASAQSPASDAFARLLERQSQNAAGRNAGQTPLAATRQERSATSSRSDSQDKLAEASNSSSRSQSARSTTTDKRAETGRADGANGAAQNAATGAAGQSSSSQVAGNNASATDSANSGSQTNDASATANAAAAVANPAQAGKAGAEASGPAVPLNPLVLQIQQLTERSRLLADTVVALRTHPETLPASPEALVQALSDTPLEVSLPLELAPVEPEAMAPQALSADVLAQLTALGGTTQAAGTATELPAEAISAAASNRGAAALPVLPATQAAQAALAAQVSQDAEPTAPLSTAQPSTQTADDALLTPQNPAFAQAAAQALAGETAARAATAPDTRVSDAIQAAAAGLHASSTPVAASAGSQAISLVGTVTAPLGAPQWGHNFSQQVVRLSTGGPDGLRHIELRLDPPDLGPVRISLSLAGEQASAIFVSPHASVRQALEQALPQLQQALADAGIQLGHTSVGEQDQARDEALTQREGGGGAASHDAEAGNDAGVAVIAQRPAPRGLVDTFA